MLEAGKKSGEKIIEEYAQTAVAIADIKIAVRSQKTGKNAEFMKKAMVNCSEINVEQLTQAALAGAEHSIWKEHLIVKVPMHCVYHRLHLNAGVIIK